MTETQVYRLERGERPNLYAITLARIALALDTNIEYLLGLTDSIHSRRCWARAYREGDPVAVEEAVSGGGEVNWRSPLMGFMN